ncbi:MAG: CvpA family protein [Longimonas sp.]|uniref:CvpA family protein n=1 Tax=Longimonas sp. TaxID=2039626 RepID=UPI0033528E31
MSLLDIGILAILALALVRGYTAGGLRQITSLVGMIIAFICAVQFMRPFGAYMVEAWEVSPMFAELLAFTGIFLGVYGGVAFVVRMFERVVKALRLGLLDRVLGSVVAGGKVILVVSGLFLLLAHAGWPAPETREASAFYEPVREALPTAWDHTAAFIGETEELHEFFPGALNGGDATSRFESSTQLFPIVVPDPDDTPGLFEDTAASSNEEAERAGW